MLHVFLVTIILALLSPGPAWAEISVSDTLRYGDGIVCPGFEWCDTGQERKAIVVAIHGVTLHSGAYKKLGAELAARGFLVVAPDLKGFGRYFHAAPTTAESQTVVYERSQEDIAELIRHLKMKHAELPVFLLGESVGGHLALRVAAKYPELINGVIVSGSSTKAHFLNVPMLAADVLHWAADHDRQLDLGPYIKRYISDDPRVAEERLSDPLSRNTLRLGQIIKFGWMSRRTIDCLPMIPPEIPVLILQGTADKLYKAHGINKMYARLRSKDKSICWFPKKGHILLETAYMREDVLDTVADWMSKRTTSVAKTTQPATGG